jgi:hypothetical protein
LAGSHTKLKTFDEMSKKYNSTLKKKKEIAVYERWTASVV